LTLISCLLAALCLVPQLSDAAPKKKGAAPPLIFVGGAEWCHYCKELQQRLASDPTVVPYSSHFRVTYVDLEKQGAEAEFAKRFGLQEVSLPTLVVAAPNGTPIAVRNGSPQGDALPRVLAQSLATLGIKVDNAVAKSDTKGKTKEPERDEKEPRAKKAVAKEKEKDPDAEARLAAVREARKLLQEKKTADAVAVVAPFADMPRSSDQLGRFIASLEKEGRGMVASACHQLDKPELLAVGTVALVKARRLYGKLPAVQKEIDAGLEIIAKAPHGNEVFLQAEAVDKGRALDEAGEAAAALAVYRSVATQYANSPVAAMASKRIEHLQKATTN
jgi:hypothetical protein